LDSGFYVYFNRWERDHLRPFQDGCGDTGKETSFLQAFAKQFFNLGFDLPRQNVGIPTGTLRLSLPRSGAVLLAVVIVGFTVGVRIHRCPTLPTKQEAVK